MTATVFAFFLAAFAGIPLTSGFTAKFAVFRAAWEGGAWVLVVIGVVMSAVAAFFYFRVVVLMFFSAPAPDGPTVAVLEPAHDDHHRAQRRCHTAARRLPGPGPRAGRPSHPVRPLGERSTCPPEHRITAPATDPGLAEALRHGLDQVEAALHDAVKSDYPFVTEASTHLVDAGGKRSRPLLVLLASQFGDPTAPGVVPSAVVVELTHLATLYHDDVMDEAALRRGAASANARWDNTVAILTGDFLFARASDILADLGPDAVRLQARTFERLVTGQIRETVGPVRRAPTRSSTTCRCWPTRPAR